MTYHDESRSDAVKVGWKSSRSNARRHFESACGSRREVGQRRPHDRRSCIHIRECYALGRAIGRRLVWRREQRRADAWSPCLEPRFALCRIWIATPLVCFGWGPRAGRLGRLCVSTPLLTGRSWAAVGLSMRACAESSGGRLVTPLSSGYCCGCCCCCDASLAYFADGSGSCCLCDEHSTTTLCFRIVFRLSHMNLNF